jgi:hypothetical protein
MATTSVESLIARPMGSTSAFSSRARRVDEGQRAAQKRVRETRAPFWIVNSLRINSVIVQSQLRHPCR